ncbi:BQ5605_C010g05904 [Microbotryum silenes-dioicae]|uniref:BQ5605_C010g05904 protein n=1 Tax=Microbotryum silenes-dioicae TaxID=796604 RepID=A0A2X0MJ79_9BASI|nr:BQ5605_C010g05904 [Microbotryum silenes-dioicae]
MYQHTVVSAAPACGVGVPIRSHVQALWDSGRAIATSPSLGREDSAVPWASSSARCWAPRGSTLLFVPHRSTEPAPARVMTTMQPILALRHVYEPAASAPGSNRAQTPQAHVSIRDDLGPQTAVCTHCKARHWECERSKSTRHFSACCSQGKVRLPPPPQPNLEYRQLLQGSDSEAVAFRENARSYNNTLSFTSLAALWDQTQVGTLGPPVFRVFGRLYHRLGKDLILQVHGDRCPDGRPKYQISRSTMVSNCARYLPVSVWMTKTNRRTKTATMRMKTARKGTKRMGMANDEGQVKGSRWRVSRSQFFAHYLPNATSTSQSRIAPNVPSWNS